MITKCKFDMQNEEVKRVSNKTVVRGVGKSFTSNFFGRRREHGLYFVQRPFDVRRIQITIIGIGAIQRVHRLAPIVLRQKIVEVEGWVRN